MVGAFGLDESAARPVPYGRVNRVFRAVRQGAAVALRQSAWFRSVDEVAYEADVLVRIHAAGAPVPAVVHGPVELASGIWMATEWIDGDHPVPPVDPAPFGALLARLHGTTMPLAHLGQRPGWARVGEFSTAPRGDGSACLADVFDDFERAFGALGRRLRYFADMTGHRLGDASRAGTSPDVIAHGDFGPHQTIWRGGKLGAVVDWDFCHLDLATADLAIATSLARPTVERARAMIRAYLDAVPFEVGDLDRLADHRRAFHLSNLANQVCALWRHGVDVDRQVQVIAARLEREQWWEAMLRAALRPARGSSTTGGVDASEVVPASTDSSSDGAAAPGSTADGDLAVALELADRARVVATHYFATGVVTELKDDQSPVTDADRAVEHLIRESLRALRPDDAILGEEYGQEGDAARTWIVDPIDGTASFAAGDPHWRVQIALQDGDEIVVAVVDEPALDRRFWAERGGGAFEAVGDGRARRLRVAGDERAAIPIVAVHPPGLVDRLPEHQPMVPRSPLPLVELVRGAIDAFLVECCQIWDHAPWVLLVEEAGGRFTDHDGGRRPDRRGGLYATAAWHDRLWARLR